MSLFKFEALDRGLWVQCQCSAEMLLPPETLSHDMPVYCPCGALDYVSKEAVNKLQAVMFKLATDAGGCTYGAFSVNRC